MKLIAFLAAFALAALLFILAPELDVAFSRLFHREGEGFFLRGWPPIAYSYKYTPLIATLTGVLVAALTLLRLTPGIRRLHVRGRVIAYIGLSLAIGPWLVTNEILKDNLGRARPKQTVEFGGTRAFTPAFVVSDECPKNCAFVSGHAATGFFLVTFAFLMAPGRLRKAAFAGAVAVGAAAGMGRVAVGSHYLSDIVFAGFINIAVAWALYVWVVERNGFAGPPFDRWRRWAGSLRRRLSEASPAARRGLHAAAAAAIGAIAVIFYFFLDRSTHLWFKSQGEDFYLVAHEIADFGRSEFWLIPSFVVFAALWLAARRSREPAARGRFRAWSMVPLFVFVSISVTGVAAQLLKIAFGRIRPKIFDSSGDYGFAWFELDGALQSFPSGHAVTIATLMTALFFAFPRYIAAYVSIGAVIILARAAEGDHYISDILVGGYLGIVLTMWLRRVFERSGIDIAAAAEGRSEAGPKVPWAERLGLRTPLLGNVAAVRARRNRRVPPTE